MNATVSGAEIRRRVTDDEDSWRCEWADDEYRADLHVIDIAQSSPWLTAFTTSIDDGEDYAGYSLCPDELRQLRDWIDEQLKRIAKRQEAQR